MFSSCNRKIMMVVTWLLVVWYSCQLIVHADETGSNLTENESKVDRVCQQIKVNSTAELGIAETEPGESEIPQMKDSSNRSAESSQGTDTTHSFYFWANATSQEKYWNQPNTSDIESEAHTADGVMMTGSDTIENNQTNSAEVEQSEGSAGSVGQDITTELTENEASSSGQGITPSIHFWANMTESEAYGAFSESEFGANVTSSEHLNDSETSELTERSEQKISLSRLCHICTCGAKSAKIEPTDSNVLNRGEPESENINESVDEDLDDANEKYSDADNGFILPGYSDSNSDKFAIADYALEMSLENDHDSGNNFTAPDCIGTFSTEDYFVVISQSKNTSSEVDKETEQIRYENKPNSNSENTQSLNFIPRSVRRITVDPYNVRRSQRQTKIFKSIGKLTTYAGYFQVNPAHEAHLFFWFFRSKTNWRTAPVIVWIQGEPGLSSLYGLFEEHGPYQIHNTTTGLTINLREHSWVDLYNVLYLDHCIGCGFSLARAEEAYVPSYANVGNNVYQALYQFFRAFPQYQDNDLYLTGSYGSAKYIPVIANLIHTRNKFSKVFMNLKGMLIGGPYMDAAAMAQYEDYLKEKKIINDSDISNVGPYVKQLIYAGKYHRAIGFMENKTFHLLKKAGYENLYDARYKTPPEGMHSYEQYVPQIVKTNQFRKMICLSQVGFQHKSKILIPEIMDPVDHLIVELLQHYKILFYVGEYDLMALHNNSLPYLFNLRWKHIDSYYSSSTRNWWANHSKRENNSLPDGEFRSYNNLVSIVLRNAGHTYGDSEKLLSLLKEFVDGGFNRKPIC